MPWSRPIRLADYDDVPREQGVYEIGYFRNGAFNHRYIGKAASIWSRLNAHYNGNGNRGIAEYLDNAGRDNLYCRWMRTEEAAQKEANMLDKYGYGPNTRYPWNRKGGDRKGE